MQGTTRLLPPDVSLHLKSFCKQGNPETRDAFWQLIGQTSQAWSGEHWLKTHDMQLSICISAFNQIHHSIQHRHYLAENLVMSFITRLTGVTNSKKNEKKYAHYHHGNESSSFSNSHSSKQG